MKISRATISSRLLPSISSDGKEPTSMVALPLLRRVGCAALRERASIRP